MFHLSRPIGLRFPGVVNISHLIWGRKRKEEGKVVDNDVAPPSGGGEKKRKGKYEIRKNMEPLCFARSLASNSSSFRRRPKGREKGEKKR